ncbi:MAG: ABC transporter permease [Paracoccus sp. (in: a-proteobacteria)]|jgi:simple sugar transport system permease protein|uniref:ABC transporter permease n=1 Tax=unclassified Paracoccus (in: a-proteobacteria) TaxID=2688777 RepID=UPI000C5A7748|nr:MULTISPECIES: ABC transporter permease [unclassified Paracoccus (in: a-proteobacteria)]MAN57670.1 ABC transporter permease [Paracoccus sp. (in: a-proteobacteria)]MBA48629.1 ABC transporter permease [Paracoccus sp. (in: a-proteobacteria)]MDB2552041.1 ABC transporter permease [Paracoccus sp. (in: a-proteobacteria)]|tara:strand:+ start:741 stop:1628 length:888 start_codon:yes stop_codon:yes gene_type:complete
MIDPLSVFLLLLAAATPILFAALGELVVERAGVLNLGVEGMMITGALAGFAAAYVTGSPFAGFLAAALAGAAIAMLFAALTQILLANQVASGLALTLFGLGLAALFGKPLEGIKAPAMMPGPLRINWIVWLGLVMVPLVWWFLNRSRTGLILRGVGENHDAAHALGYPVHAIRIAAIGFGGAMAGVGGAFISIATVLQWTEGMTAGAGWIALAIVVFSNWTAPGVLAGAWLFGGVTVLQLRLQAAGIRVPVQLLSMAPYLATIIVLVLISARQKYSRRAGRAAPGSLGQNFHALR